MNANALMKKTKTELVNMLLSSYTNYETELINERALWQDKLDNAYAAAKNAHKDRKAANATTVDREKKLRAAEDANVGLTAKNEVLVGLVEYALT